MCVRICVAPSSPAFSPHPTASLFLASFSLLLFLRCCFPLTLSSSKCGGNLRIELGSRLAPPQEALNSTKNIPNANSNQAKTIILDYFTASPLFLRRFA